MPPKYVWEVKADSFSRSPFYPLGSGRLDEDASIGLSLRFPRLIRQRDDKTKSTTVEEIVDLYFMSII